MKRMGQRKWLVWLLAVFLLVPVTGCGKSTTSANSESSGSADDLPTRHATLMGVRNFKEAFKPRGRMTDHAESTDSAEKEAPVSLLVRNVDGDANVFYYIDATGTVDLDDMEKETYIPYFQKSLNRNSDVYHYSKMELLDRGDNFYEFKVSIENRVDGEDLSSEEETETEEKDVSKKENTSQEQEQTVSENEAVPENDDSSVEESAEVQVEKESKPMVFFYIKKGKKIYEIIGLDMEAEDSTAFSGSFQEILDEIVTVEEVSSEAEADEAAA